ncbi:MAG: circadian clock KaiB family protein [Solirubrobacteraceae bacterium]|jgi:circadian clock protein KaiB
MNSSPASDSPEAEHFLLRLYVAGMTPKSLTALSNLKRICEERVDGHYEIEVIDLRENPQLAAGQEIIAVPTLVRSLPEPIVRIIGDLSDTERVVVGLQLTTLQPAG